jgi:hypothetical protein
MKKKAKKKEKKINLNKIEKKGNISRKKRMKNEIIVVFLIAILLIRKSFNYSV